MQDNKPPEAPDEDPRTDPDETEAMSPESVPESVKSQDKAHQPETAPEAQEAAPEAATEAPESRPEAERHDDPEPERRYGFTASTVRDEHGNPIDPSAIQEGQVIRLLNILDNGKAATVRVNSLPKNEHDESWVGGLWTVLGKVVPDEAKPQTEEAEDKAPEDRFRSRSDLFRAFRGLFRLWDLCSRMIRNQGLRLTGEDAEIMMEGRSAMTQFRGYLDNLPEPDFAERARQVAEPGQDPTPIADALQQAFLAGVLTFPMERRYPRPIRMVIRNIGGLLRQMEEQGGDAVKNDTDFQAARLVYNRYAAIVGPSPDPRADILGDLDVDDPITMLEEVHKTLGGQPTHEDMAVILAHLREYLDRYGSWSVNITDPRDLPGQTVEDRQRDATVDAWMHRDLGPFTIWGPGSQLVARFISAATLGWLRDAEQAREVNRALQGIEELRAHFQTQPRPPSRVPERVPPRTGKLDGFWGTLLREKVVLADRSVGRVIGVDPGRKRLSVEIPATAERPGRRVNVRDVDVMGIVFSEPPHRKPSMSLPPHERPSQRTMLEDFPGLQEASPSVPPRPKSPPIVTPVGEGTNVRGVAHSPGGDDPVQTRLDRETFKALVEATGEYPPMFREPDAVNVSEDVQVGLQDGDMARVSDPSRIKKGRVFVVEGLRFVAAGDAEALDGGRWRIPVEPDPATAPSPVRRRTTETGQVAPDIRFKGGLPPGEAYHAQKVKVNAVIGADVKVHAPGTEYHGHVGQIEGIFRHPSGELVYRIAFPGFGPRLAAFGGALMKVTPPGAPNQPFLEDVQIALERTWVPWKGEFDDPGPYADKVRQGEMNTAIELSPGFTIFPQSIGTFEGKMTVVGQRLQPPSILPYNGPEPVGRPLAQAGGAYVIEVRDGGRTDLWGFLEVEPDEDGLHVFEAENWAGVKAICKTVEDAFAQIGENAPMDVRVLRGQTPVFEGHPDDLPSEDPRHE